MRESLLKAKIILGQLVTLVQEWMRKIDILLPILAALPIATRYLLLDVTTIGSDTQTHLYKATLLKEQMQGLPFLLWGSWDWNWYAGYPFLKLYGPLFYYVTGGISIVLNLPVDLVARVVIPLFFVFSALSMYFCALQLTGNKLASASASAIYVYIPYHVMNISIGGSPGVLLGFVFAPLAFLFADKFSQTRQNKYGIAGASFLTTVLLSNQAVGLLVIVLVALYLLFQKKMSALITVMVETFLISAFWLIPYLPCLGATAVPVQRSELYATYILQLLHEQNIGIVPLVVVCVSVPLLLRGSKRDKKSLIILGLVLLLTAYNIVVYIYPVPLLMAFALGRTLSGFALLIPLLVAFFLKSVKRKYLIASIIVALTIAEGLSIPAFSPLGSEKYMPAFNHLRQDKQWFRILFVPREPVGTLIPMFANRSVIDGWFDQGSPTASVVHIIADSHEYTGEPMEPMLMTDPDRALSVLGYLGVKYIVADAANPTPTTNFSRALDWSIGSSQLVERVYTNGSVEVFRLSTFTQITFATKTVSLNNTEEFLQWITNRDQNTAFIYNGQEGLLPRLNGGNINYAIHSIVQSHQDIKYTIDVDQPVLAVLPISYDRSLMVTVNQKTANFFKVPPNLIAVPLESAGGYDIDIAIGSTWDQKFALLTSAVTFILLLGYESFNIKWKFPRRWLKKKK